MELLRPVFVLGNPRSGTTLLRLMMHAHPEICIPPECGFLEWWHEKYRDWSLEDSHGVRTDLFLSDLKQSRKIETWELDFGQVKDRIRSSGPGCYAELVAQVYLAYAYGRGKKLLKIWGDKNNYYLRRTELLNALFPEARYILIVRDGRDVACSYRELSKLQSDSPYKPELPVEIDEIAREWNDNNQSVLNFFQRINGGRCWIVRYEDLVQSPALRLSELCSFLQIAYSTRMLDYDMYNRKDGTEPSSTLDWKRKTLQKPDTDKVGVFRADLSQEEVNVFNQIAHPMLSNFNYLSE
jgi:hypothetical protein